MAVAVRVKRCEPSGKPKAMKDKSLQGLGFRESSCEDAGAGSTCAHVQWHTDTRKRGMLHKDEEVTVSLLEEETELAVVMGETSHLSASAWATSLQGLCKDCSNRHDMAGHDMTRHDKTWQDMA